MGDVVYGKFGDDPAAEYREFADKHNLDIQVTSGGSVFIHGKSFRTPKGERVESSFGYLRPTGQCRARVNGDEEIEVVCMRSKRTKFIKLSLLQPFRFVDSLED